MMKNNKLNKIKHGIAAQLNRTSLLFAIGATGLMLPSLVQAAGGYIDYRHEYLSTQRVHYDRSKIGYFFDNGFNIHYEIMWKSGGDKTPHKNNNGQTTRPSNRDKWGDFEDNGHGVIMNYNYKHPDLKDWTFIPTFSVYSSSYWTTYEPGLEVNYRITPEYIVRARYRLDLDRPTSSNTAKNQKTNRYDFWFDWKPGGLPISMTYNFVWYDTENIRWNNQSHDYAQEIKLNYKMGKWTPYAALGDVKGPDKYSDNRQLRWRGGLSYSF